MTYPKYYKTSAHHIKSLDDNNSLWITDNKIDRHSFFDLQHLIALEATESTESEFKAAFNKTNKYLKSLI